MPQREPLCKRNWLSSRKTTQTGNCRSHFKAFKSFLVGTNHKPRDYLSTFANIKSRWVTGRLQLKQISVEAWGYILSEQFMGLLSWLVCVQPWQTGIEPGPSYILCCRMWGTKGTSEKERKGERPGEYVSTTLDWNFGKVILAGMSKMRF